MAVSRIRTRNLDALRGDHVRRGASDGRRKICNQCRKPKALRFFALKPNGQRKQDCRACATKYRGWNKLTIAEKLARRPKRTDERPRGFVLFQRRSQNRKLGGIPMSISERGTCPTSCAFYDQGCFAEFGWNGVVWRNVGSKKAATPGRRGLTWDQFLGAVRALPEGTLWRHNVAGDLPGDSDTVNSTMLDQLVIANIGRRGFTYTHKHFGLNTGMRSELRYANRMGFTINVSADTLEEADRFARTGLPVVAVVPEDAPLRLKTPGGRRVVICPAETEAKLTCAECQLCAIPTRKSIIGFRAHGQFKALVSELVRSKRKEESRHVEQHG